MLKTMHSGNVCTATPATSAAYVSPMQTDSKTSLSLAVLSLSYTPVRKNRTLSYMSAFTYLC
jgi:hypothetical protein